MSHFRFECRFCNHPITVPEHAAGKKMKCPKCKNPVKIPVPQGAVNQSYEDTGQKLERKNQKKRPIQSRYQWNTLRSLIKWMIIAGIVYGGYTMYNFHKSQSNKSVGELFVEISDSNTSAAEKEYYTTLVKTKVTSDDFDTITSYSASNDAEIRALVAACLGELGKEKRSLDVLEKYLTKDISQVKIAAAEALGKVYLPKSIDILIGRLEVEEDQEVKGAIGRSLRNMTGQTGNAVNATRWKSWWDRSKKGYTFPQY